MLEVVDVVYRIDQRLGSLYERGDLFAGFQHHFPKRPADSDVANVVHGLECRPPSEAFLRCFLGHLVALCRVVAAWIHKPGHLDTFV